MNKVKELKTIIDDSFFQNDEKFEPNMFKKKRGLDESYFSYGTNFEIKNNMFKPKDDLEQFSNNVLYFLGGAAFALARAFLIYITK